METVRLVLSLKSPATLKLKLSLNNAVNIQSMNELFDAIEYVYLFPTDRDLLRTAGERDKIHDGNLERLSSWGVEETRSWGDFYRKKTALSRKKCSKTS